MVILWLLVLAVVSPCLANPQLHIKWGQSSKHSSGYVLHRRPQYGSDYDYYYGGDAGGYGDYAGDYAGDYDYGHSDYGRFHRRQGDLPFPRICSCSLYVESTQVFNRTKESSWFTCNQPGLERCSRYCRNLFRDPSLRATSRQDACGVLSLQVNTPWLRKVQVCSGTNGLSRDINLPVNLCCLSGTPATPCT